jgi:hypothetical protein
MHLSAAVAQYTRRHHKLAALFESLAKQAGLTAHHEVKPYVASPSLSETDKRKQLDTRLDGVEYELLERIDPREARDAAQSSHGGATMSRAALLAVLLDVLVDYTFHHPAAYLGQSKSRSSRITYRG